MSIRNLPLETPPRRVVSLVPSLTESFFELGFGDRVVGITDYCIYPADALVDIPHVGGPKTLNIEHILRLKPDLIAANQEENSQGLIEALMRLGLPVWLTFPVTVEDAIGDLWNLARLFRSERAQNLIRGLEKSLEYLQMAGLDQPKKRTFCPIWQGKLDHGLAWWMTFNQQTFSHDLIEKLGGENVFKDRKRRYPLMADLSDELPEDPGARDTRYPRISLEEIIRMDPELVLLPDEPYAFGPEDLRFFQAQCSEALQHPLKVRLIEGSLITWPGTRIAKAVERLSEYFS